VYLSVPLNDDLTILSPHRPNFDVCNHQIFSPLLSYSSQHTKTEIVGNSLNLKEVIRLNDRKWLYFSCSCHEYVNDVSWFHSFEISI